MKLQSALAASLFAAMATPAFNANAAADAPADTKAKTEKAAPSKKMMPHSHVEEKTGFPQKTPKAMPDNSGAAKDLSKHFHPRDGK